MAYWNIILHFRVEYLENDKLTVIQRHVSSPNQFKRIHMKNVVKALSFWLLPIPVSLTYISFMKNLISNASNCNVCNRCYFRFNRVKLNINKSGQIIKKRENIIQWGVKTEFWTVLIPSCKLKLYIYIYIYIYILFKYYTH